MDVTMEDLIEFAEANSSLRSQKIDFDYMRDSYKVGSKRFSHPEKAMAYMVSLVKGAK